MTANARERRPNVVLFISDEQRADTIAQMTPGMRAASGIYTPHLAWLAERGTLFRNAYCASPICSPARSTILTGLYPHATGLVANNQARPIANEIHLAPHVQVLADYLKPTGYACAYFGKWHLGTGGDRRGFDAAVTRSGDHEVDGPEQNDVQRFCERIGITLGQKRKGVEPDEADYDARTKIGASRLPLAFHPSVLHARAAAEFIHMMEHDTRPFTLVYSCHEPHPPFVSPRPFDRMYAGAQLPLPENRNDPAGRSLVERRYMGKGKAASTFDDGDLRKMWAAYYGGVSFVDHLVGVILAALIETDQMDDTLFIFTSDHGELLGAHNMLGKGAFFYEELVNVPLLIAPPGRTTSPPASQEVTSLVSHADLAPTILGWCGAEIPSGLHGVDIRALVEGSDHPVREGVAFEFYTSNWGEPPIPLRGWRTPEWKYVEAIDGTDELYSLVDDPQEMHNLVGEPGYTDVRTYLKADLQRWLDRTNDPWPNNLASLAHRQA